jgi:hypothetical protein
MSKLTRTVVAPLFSVLGLVLVAGVVARHAASQQMDDAQQLSNDLAADSGDPPAQVGRVSVLSGTVSYEPASANDFAPAEVNYPLTTGDRLYADTGSTAEIQTGELAVRMGQLTDLTVTAMTNTLAQFGLGQGSVHLRSFQLDPNVVVELDTPNVAVTVLQPGDVRVDVDPRTDTTTVTLISGMVQVDGNGLEQQLQPGERVRLSGSDPVAAQWTRMARQDGLDIFSAERDSVLQTGEAAENGYVDQQTIGGDDLSANGDWSNDADYGAVWYPRGVAVDWQPYCYGHWAWIAPWGWTWVEAEPWGFAPFHYGRWARFGPRWGWIPGPRIFHPVYSPALVVFVGSPGASVSAWFPLGPRETYVPWYHASPVYVNRVNVTNIYVRDPNAARRIYNQRTLAYAPPQPSQRWVNRQVATIAVPKEAFASGRPVAQNRARIAPEQLATSPILQHPTVTPERSMVVQSPARVLPPRLARPVLTSDQERGLKPGQAPGGGVGNPGHQPVMNSQPAPISRAPAGAPTPSPARGVMPTQPGVQEQAPQRPGFAPTPNPARGAAPVQPAAASTQEQAPLRPGGSMQPNPARGVEPAANGGGQPERPVAMPAPAQQEQPRPLYNRAVPPPARPDFEQERQTIQNTEPGRPLSQQQMQTMPRNQPPPRPAPAPAPRPAPPPPPKAEDKKK